MKGFSRKLIQRKISDVAVIIKDQWVIDLRKSLTSDEPDIPVDPCKNCPQAQGNWHLKGVYDKDNIEIDTKGANAFMIGYDDNGNMVNKPYKIEIKDGNVSYTPVD